MRTMANYSSGPWRHGWQIVDRPSEFRAVRSALTGSDCCGVVLVGAAGVGKTTLARAVTGSLRSSHRALGGVDGIVARLPLGRLRASGATVVIARSNRALGIGTRIPCLATKHHRRSGQRTSARSAVGEHLCPSDRRRQRGSHSRDGADRRTRTRCCHVPVEDGYLRRFELHPFARRRASPSVESVIGGTLEGLSGRSDVGVLGRETRLSYGIWWKARSTRAP